jgi:hypothetical protein
MRKNDAHSIPENDPRRQPLIRFGSTANLAEQCREARGLHFFENLAARLIGTGMLIGLALAFPLNAMVRNFLIDVAPTDPATFAAVAVLLTAMALLASYVPARRALKVNPPRCCAVNDRPKGRRPFSS